MQPSLVRMLDKEAEDFNAHMCSAWLDLVGKGTTGTL